MCSISRRRGAVSVWPTKSGRTRCRSRAWTRWRRTWPSDSRPTHATTPLAPQSCVTNNPAKVRGLEVHGVRIAAREPLLVEASSQSAAYLATKARRLGHLIPPDAIAG